MKNFSGASRSTSRSSGGVSLLDVDGLEEGEGAFVPRVGGANNAIETSFIDFWKIFGHEDLDSLSSPFGQKFIGNHCAWKAVNCALGGFYIANSALIQKG